MVSFLPIVKPPAGAPAASRRALPAAADRVFDRRLRQPQPRALPAVQREPRRRWQERFGEAGVDGLLADRTRPPGKAPVADERLAKLVRLTHEPPPHVRPSRAAPIYLLVDDPEAQILGDPGLIA